MPHLLLDFLQLLLATEQATACWAYANYPDSTPSPDTNGKVNATNLTYTDGDAIGRNINHSWGGWKPPHNVRQQWQRWLKNYEENQAAARDPREYADQRQDWPDSWKGRNETSPNVIRVDLIRCIDLGAGEGGDNPPPWAYGPRNTGLPDFCYMKPERGNCTENLIRWGFNPYSDECQPFNYSGCGENRNNFMVKLRCEQACMLEPISGCDTEAHIDPADI